MRGLRALAVLALLSPAGPALAASCPHCGQAYSENYPPGSPQKALDRSRHEASCAGRSGGGGSTPSLSPADQMTLQMMQTGAEWAGNELHKMLWGDPVEEARKAEEARSRAAEAARVRAEQEAAAARRREELHANLMRALKLTGAGEVALKGFDGAPAGEGGMKLKLTGDGEGMKPQGTSFFGTGGGPGGAGPAGHSDPMVVDLRDLRRGAYLVQQAESAPPLDAEILLQDALNAATGQGGPPIPLERCPEVGEQGLLEFQKANRDYREAREAGRLSEERHRAALQDVDRARREAMLRRIEAEAQEDPDGKRRAAFQDALRSLRERMRVQEEARAVAEAERARISLADWGRRALLKLAARPDPGARTYADALREERERLDPGLAGRARHYALRSSSLPAEEVVVDRLRRDYLAPPADLQALQPRLQGMVDRLVAASPYPDDRIEVLLLGMPRDPAKASGMESNACAYATRVAVGERFLRDWQARGANEDELAFVLGHEVAHAQGDHWSATADKVRRTALPEGIRYPDVTEAQFQLMPEHQQRETVELFRARASVQEAWLGLQHRDLRQGQETEADRASVTLALAAGYKPDGPRRAFGWLAAAEKASEPRHASARAFHEASADHPAATTRFADLQRIWGKALGEPPSP